MHGQNGDFGETVFAGESAGAERLRRQVARFAPHFRLVLVTGEAGTGKESVARALHRMSPAAAGAFVACEVQDFVASTDTRAGVLYLRGLGALGADRQDALLAALDGIGREQRMVVECACDPRGMVAAGRMRAEVLERVGMLEIRVPALRERMEDLPAIVAGMQGDGGFCLPADALERMAGHGWPGNLEELRRVCEGFRTRGVLEFEATETDSAVAVAVRLDDVIERHVMGVLERCAGNKLKAAEMLGISRSTLYADAGVRGCCVDFGDEDDSGMGFGGSDGLGAGDRGAGAAGAGNECGGAERGVECAVPRDVGSAAEAVAGVRVGAGGPAI